MKKSVCEQQVCIALPLSLVSLSVLKQTQELSEHAPVVEVGKPITSVVVAAAAVASTMTPSANTTPTYRTLNKLLTNTRCNYGATKL